MTKLKCNVLVFHSWILPRWWQIWMIYKWCNWCKCDTGSYSAYSLEKVYIYLHFHLSSFPETFHTPTLDISQAKKKPFFIENIFIHPFLFMPEKRRVKGGFRSTAGCLVPNINLLSQYTIRMVKESSLNFTSNVKRI